MKRSLASQTILITGANGGFGQCLTRQLLREGANLILADLQRGPLVQSAEAAARAVPHARGSILGFVEADLATPAGAAQLHAAATAISPQIDMLINNAGIGMMGRIDHIPAERWERLMQVNLLAPMRLTQLFVPQMVERKSGHLVNICSAASLVGSSGMSIYNASKFGLRGFSEALAHDLRRHGVAVTAIYPFFSRTPILDSEQFGYASRRVLPARVIYDPEFIIATLIQGIKAGKIHIYPGWIAKQIHLMRRFGP